MSYNLRKKKEPTEPDRTYTDNNGNEYKWACCEDESLPTEDAIGCDGVDLHGEQCIYWTHFICAGFDEKTIDILQNGTTEITFFCKHCKKRMHIENINKPKKKVIKKKKTINPNNTNISSNTNANTNNKESQIVSTPPIENVIEMRWVQCDKCGKWRRIPTSVPDSEFEAEWACDQNKWDLKRADCSIKEETYDPMQEETIKINESKTNIQIDVKDVPMLEFITNDKPVRHVNGYNHNGYNYNGYVNMRKDKQEKKNGNKCPGYKRLCKELQSLVLNPPKGIGACIKNDYQQKDMMHWFATIDGPENTPYYGFKFYLNINFSANYPFEPPKVVFKTKIYHCNINTKNGQICLDVLKDGYTPALTVEKILLSVSVLLEVPNPDDPLVPNIAKLYLADRKKHDLTATEWALRYAETLNPHYQIE